MTQLRLQRNGIELGSFSIEEIARGIANGQFKPEDLIASENKEDWQPLGKVVSWPSTTAKNSVTDFNEIKIDSDLTVLKTLSEMLLTAFISPFEKK